MLKNRVVLVMALLSVFVLGSLASSAVAGSGAPRQPNLPIEPPWLPTEILPEATATPDVNLAAVQAAVDAFAAELQVLPESIRVVEVTAVDWPNSALGCPKPGEHYLPVIIPGYIVKLEAGEDAEYATATYHTSDGTVGPLRAVRCDELRVPPAEDRTVLAVQAAIAAFALELEVAPETITVLAVEPMDWPNSALGCPKPGQSYLQVVTPGYLVELMAGVEAKFARATYHTDDGSVGSVRVVRCDRM